MSRFNKKNTRKTFNYFITLLILIIAAEILVFLLVKKEYFLSRLPTFNNSFQQSISQKSCQDIPETVSKYQCWEELLELILKEKGIKDAFLVFDDLYRTERQFASGCHGYAHRLGEITYQLLIKGQDFDFPPQTAYCGYGFYHGLTELLIQTKGPKEAGKLCDSKKSEITQVLYDACYHGIGHGALSQTAQSDVWGNPQEMVNSALNLCQEATNDSIQKSRCASGAFMELGNNFSEGKLQLTSLRNDPLSICRQQQDFGKMDCYTQMNGVLNSVAGGRLKESAKFVEAIDEDKYAIEAIITLAAPTIDITNPDYTDDIQVCRNLQKRLHLPCIKGLVLGFMLRGQPGIEYEQAIKFCKLSTFSEDERESCNELLLRHSSEMYSKDTMKIICSQVESQHKQFYCSS